MARERAYRGQTGFELLGRRTWRESGWMAMVRSFGLPGVVDVGDRWTTAGRGGEFPTAELVGYGAVATVVAPDSSSVSLFDSWMRPQLAG